MRLTVDERVQDGHGTVGNTSVGVDLLEDWKRKVNIRKEKIRKGCKSGKQTLVDVGAVGLLASL